MVSTRKHCYSEEQGFGDPYDGFGPDPPTYRVSRQLVGPMDDHILSEFVDVAGIDSKGSIR